MQRQQRLLAMLVALQERRRTTAEELASRFGVSQRTVLRDVAALAAADVPVFAERGRYGGIVLLPGTQIDTSRLGAAETEVLQILGLDLAGVRELGIEEPAKRLLAKAQTAAQGSSHNRTQTMLLPLADVVTVDHRGWFEPAAPTDVASLAADVRTGNRLRIRYRHSGQGAALWRTVDPYGLLLRAGRWYLVADHNGGPRLYALTRLERWEMSATPRLNRDGVTLNEVANELGSRLEDDAPVLVTAELDASHRDIAERILGTRLRATEASDRKDAITITVAYPELGAVRQLLQFAEHIRVLEPAPARELIHHLAQQIARQHAAGRGSRTVNNVMASNISSFS